MKVIAVRAKLDGVGHYRVSIPALALRERGHVVDILDAKPRQKICNKWFAGYDVAILQNLVDPGWIQVIKTIPEEWRPVTLGCIDDLVTGLDKTNPLYHEYELAAVHFVKCMKLVDGMIFSTDVLRERYSALNSNSFTVPNCLDIPGHRDWDTPEPRMFPDRFVVGWLGGRMHNRDEECMAEGLRAFLDATPKALFAYCGNRNLGFQWKRSIGIRDEQWAFLDPDDFDGYQKRISQFDVGVAPLRNTEFNRSKSDLRLLEYGAWGVPYVASDIDPYSRFHSQSGSLGGFLAGDRHEWNNSLVELSDRIERSLRGDAIKGWVREHRGRDACGLMWENALQGAIDNAKRSKPAESVSNPASCGN